MIGSWKWNAYVGLTAMLITFLSSLANNEWMTSLIRSVYGFAIVFAVMYAARFLLGTVAGMKHYSQDVMQGEAKPRSDSTGLAVDLSTPDDERLLSELLKQQLASEPQAADEFRPLEPQKLVSKEKLDPQLLAQSLRQMSEE